MKIEINEEDIKKRVIEAIYSDIRNIRFLPSDETVLNLILTKNKKLEQELVEILRKKVLEVDLNKLLTQRLLKQVLYKDNIEYD